MCSSDNEPNQIWFHGPFLSPLQLASEKENVWCRYFLDFILHRNEAYYITMQIIGAVYSRWMEVLGGKKNIESIYSFLRCIEKGIPVRKWEQHSLVFLNSQCEITNSGMNVVSTLHKIYTALCTNSVFGGKATISTNFFFYFYQSAIFRSNRRKKTSFSNTKE